MFILRLFSHVIIYSESPESRGHAVTVRHAFRSSCGNERLIGYEQLSDPLTTQC